MPFSLSLYISSSTCMVMHSIENPQSSRESLEEMNTMHKVRIIEVQK